MSCTVSWPGGSEAESGVEPETTPDAPLYPALSRVEGAERIPARHLMDDATCAECHADISEQWQRGMHRLSSFPGFDPDTDPTAHAGITCIGCHAITRINSPRGNGDYSILDPPRYPFAFSESPWLKTINRQLVRAKPALHKQTWLKPVHRSAEFCSACHKVHLPYAFNHYKWLRGQDHYDSFLQSGVSGHRVDSFYYPPRAVERCAVCHMPLTRSNDPAARDFADSGLDTVHNHLFAAGNTGVPHLLHPEGAVAAERRAMLEGGAGWTCSA